MPAIFESFGFDSVPLAQITNFARILSPRSVSISQCLSTSFQVVFSTVVRNTARS